MKKLLLILLCLPFIGFGKFTFLSDDFIINPIQKHNNQVVLDNLIEQTVNSSFNSTSTLIWESDFSDPNDWVIDNQGGGGGAFGWTIDATVESWYFNSGISSTSGGNFAEVSNGNPTGSGTQLLNVTYNLTTAQPIDVFGSIGSTDALLSFEEYGARFQDLQAVQISTDGINFTTIADNLNYQILAQAGGSSYPNPSLREINLSSYLSAPGANASTVWIRFSWTTNFPTQVTNPNVWITYGWFIDDVKIYALGDDNIQCFDEVMGGYWINSNNIANSLGQDYTFYPLSQASVQPYAYEAVVKNEGIINQQNATLKVDVNNGSWTDTSSVLTLQSGEQDTINTLNFYTPSTTGIYEAKMWVEAQNQNGDYTYSDTTTKVSVVTDYEYGKDYNNPNGVFWLNRVTPIAGSFEISSKYFIYSSEDLSSIKAYITFWSTPGSIVYGKIYEEVLNANPILINQTDDYTLQAGDVDNWIFLNFSTPINLTAGKQYRIAIGSYISFTDSVGVSVSGDGEFSSDAIYDKDSWYMGGNGVASWYNISEIPMLRMVFNTITIYGCLDNSALNYNANATIDDNSCCYVSGCTDTAANNYNPTACYDDGSCLYNFGCTDSLAINYNPLATVDDGSCCYNSVNILFQESCEGYTWLINGITYYTSGTYTDTITYINGCQHIEVLELTINTVTSNSITIDTCNSYTWLLSNTTYNTSGKYIAISFNSDGCLHTDTLNLTIDSSTSNAVYIQSCESYTWPVNDITYYTSGIYIDTSTNIHGCQHLETLNLTIDYSSSNSTIIETCDTYTWPVNGTTYNTSGTYVDSNINNYGCTHIDTLKLTILEPVNTSEILGETNVDFLQIESYSVSQNINSTYEWVLNGGISGNGVVLNGANTNTVHIQWGSNIGLYDLFVVETNQFGCDDTSYITININAIPGCMDTNACNYNSLANLDDGNCIYENIQASIYQLGDSLYSYTVPNGLNVNWYNIQNQDGNTRVWLMKENSSSFVPTFECTYYITLDYAGCSVTSEEYYFGATAKRIGDLEVSPNPSKDLVNVKFDNTNNQYVYLHLMDNRGIKLDDFMTKETELDIDMTKYPSGTYYLYFDSRFVKQGCNPEDVEMISTKIILNK